MYYIITYGTVETEITATTNYEDAIELAKDIVTNDSCYYVEVIEGKIIAKIEKSYTLTEFNKKEE